MRQSPDRLHVDLRRCLLAGFARKLAKCWLNWSLGYYQVSCQCRQQGRAVNSSGERKTPSLLYAVKRLELVIRAHLDEVLRGSGVTTPQYTALSVLAHRDGISAAQLARNSFVTPQAMADMLRALQQRGLIRRIPNPDSRRERLVCITAAGRRFMRDHADAVDAIEGTMTAGLTGASTDAFRHGLTVAWQALHPGRPTS
jgi:DNA-binding MarR family transcriptional regulator